MIFDTHAHYDDEQFQEDRDALLEAMPSLGVGTIVNVSATYESCLHAVELAKKYPVYYGNGNHEHRLKLYPGNYGDMAERYEEALTKIGIHRLLNEHQLLTLVGLGNHLLDQRGLAGSEESGINIDFHSKHLLL